MHHDGPISRKKCDQCDQSGHSTTTYYKARAVFALLALHYPKYRNGMHCMVCLQTIPQKASIGESCGLFKE